MSRAALFCLVLAGCGGSLVPTNPVGDILADSFPPPIRSLEGSVVNAESVVRSGVLAVGDNEDDHEVRSFAAWSTPMPSSNQVLESATLKLHNHGQTGQPFQKLGAFHIDLVQIGSSLDPGDATRLGTARVSFANLDAGIIELDVTPLVQRALDAGSDQIGLRMRFEAAVADGGVADGVVFAAYALESTLLPPTLTLGWRTAE